MLKMSTMSPSKTIRLFTGLVLLCAAGAAPGCSSSDTGQDTATGGADTGGGGMSGIDGSTMGTGGADGGSGSASGGMGGTGGDASTGGVDGATASGGASNDAGGADAGDGGAPAYDPCPTNGDACRVMPLGDSITDGCCGENTISQGASYRYELFHLSLANGKKLTFVGSHTSGPNTVDGVTFPKSQEGHPGYTIADGGGRSGLQTRVAGWLGATPADIVLLMIGTNDVDIQLDLTNAPKRLGTLVDTIIATSPKALVVVAQIVPTQDDNENGRVRTFNAAIPAVVKARADAGKHVVSVDMYGAFTQNADFKTKLLANGLHPTDAGYAEMADVWWKAIGSLLPAK
jgi:lysophospholipase L1-like esterase